MVTVPATVKAIAIKAGFTDSAVTTVSYTKKSGGGNSGDDGSGSGGGNSGDNGNGAGSGSGNIRLGTGGDAAPVMPFIPLAADTEIEPGAEITQIRPGTRGVANPGSGNAKTPGNGMPEDGILWNVDGKSIVRDADASFDKAGDIDFSVKTGVNAIPVDIVNNVTGESCSIQISLAYEGAALPQCFS